MGELGGTAHMRVANYGIPPRAIPSSIYTIYETLTGVDPTEVPSVSFI